MIDYFAIIHKYIDPASLTYRLYLPHVTLVTYEALKIAHKLNLPAERLQFIEEAAMLHDIGIVKVASEEIGCSGDLPYLCHGVEGRNILEQEGLPKHALIAERHIGVGLSKTEIIHHNYPLPRRDMVAVSLEEKIISWADLFFGKNSNKLWVKKSAEQVRQKLGKFGPQKVAQFDAWRQLFETSVF